MTISEVATQYLLTADTLRYYEKIGLITATRTPSGIRDYSPADIRQIEFIMCMRRAGLSIAFLQKYLGLFQKGDETLGERQKILREQKVLLTQKLKDMQATMERLDYKIAYYEKQMLAKAKETKETEQKP